MIEKSRLDFVHTTYLNTIDKCAHDWGDHESMGSPRIIRWLCQFQDEDLPLAEKILSQIKYFSTENIRAGVEQLARAVFRKYGGIDRNRIVFVTMGRIHEGSAIIGRALRRETRRANIKEMVDLPKLQSSFCDVIVFVDDFSGTGNTIVDWWKMNEPIIRPIGVPFIIALLVTNHIARPRIESFSEVISVHELGQECNVISAGSKRFTDGEKKRIIKYCTKITDNAEYILGYGSCGLLIAFKHGCPNNSLPILWFNRSGWERLFLRSAL